MTLNVLQLLQCAPVLQTLSKQPLRGRVAFRIRKMAIVLQPLIQTAAISRDSLFTDENSDVLPGGNRKLRPECTETMLADPLFHETVSVDLAPLVPADLDDAVISPEELAALGPLLKEE